MRETFRRPARYRVWMNTQRHSRTPSRPAGFTLMELLVALAVIALVAALLLPLLARSRDRVRQTVCASNLRQIGVATLQYVQDNDGRMMFTGPWADDGGGVMRWDYYLPPLPQPVDYSRGSLGPYVRNAAIFSCPAAIDVQITARWQGMAPPYGFNIDFARFAYYQGDPLGLEDVNDHPPIPAAASQVQVPSQTILLADSANHDAIKGVLTPCEDIIPPSDKHPCMVGRHLGLANALWLDGHVAAGKPVAPFADTAGSGLSAAQLQGLNLGFLLKGPYTGDSKTDDYYYELTKP